MNRISLILFLIVVCTSCSMQSKPECPDQEMTVFYDPQTDTQKIDTYFLDTPYNSHVLRKIIFHTEQHGIPPADTLELFKQFMEIRHNYIALRPCIEKLVRTYVDYPEKTGQVTKTLNQLVQLASLAHSEETLQKELRKTQARRSSLEASMGISRPHS